MVQQLIEQLVGIQCDGDGLQWFFVYVVVCLVYLVFGVIDCLVVGFVIVFVVFGGFFGGLCGGVGGFVGGVVKFFFDVVGGVIDCFFGVGYGV